MPKDKHIAMGLGTIAVVAALVIGLWAWQGHKKGSAASATLGASTNQTSNQTTEGDSTAVQPGLDSNNSGLSNSGSSNQSSSSSSQSSAASMLDPSTFSKYDQYKDKTNAFFVDLKTGDGDTLSAGKQAAVYYKGWLTNGTLFDQSRPDSSGQLQAFSFTLGAHQVITGWEQGLDGMKAGGVRLLIIPPSVGYGASGQGSIPGNSVLVFQVQLAAVK